MIRCTDIAWSIKKKLIEEALRGMLEIRDWLSR